MDVSPVLRPNAFQGLRKDESLEQFVDRVVRPDTTFLKNCSDVIDKVVRRIQENQSFSVSKVIKGGSLGKGTAVRHHSDVDLLVVLNDFGDLEDSVRKMKEVKQNFAEHLKSSRFKSPVKIYDVINKSPYTLNFSVDCQSKDVTLTVDLLPIVNLFPTGTIDSTLNKYNEIMTAKPGLRKYYAKCVAQVQVDFVKTLPSKVKDLIRLFKYWNYTENDMSSYSLELIVIDAWRQRNCPKNFLLKDMVYDIADRLSDIRNIKISFEDYFEPYKFMRYMHLKPPYILDPANPFNNTAKKDCLPLNLNSFYEEQQSTRRQNDRICNTPGKQYLHEAYNQDREALRYNSENSEEPPGDLFYINTENLVYSIHNYNEIRFYSQQNGNGQFWGMLSKHVTFCLAILIPCLAALIYCFHKSESL